MAFPKVIPARQTHPEHVGFITVTARAAENGIAAGVRKGTLPKGALVLGTYAVVQTVFSGGVPVLTVGIDAAGANQLIQASFVETAAAAAVFHAPVVGTVALQAPLAADTPIFVKETGGATAGIAHFVVMYAI